MATIESIGFADALEGREDEFPLLARAVKGQRQAIREQIEWLFDADDGVRHLAENHCQIVRHPFSPDDEETREAELTKHLAAIEAVLWDGEPSSHLAPGPIPEGHLFRRLYCGGVRHYLGREPNDEDLIELRPLRDLALRHLDGDTGEWLSEFSLMVAPRQPVEVRYPA